MALLNNLKTGDKFISNITNNKLEVVYSSKKEVILNINDSTKYPLIMLPYIALYNIQNKYWTSLKLTYKEEL